MFIGSQRCISTTLRRSKRRLQARRDKRLGRIADFLRLMTRAFKCSFLTPGKFEPTPLCSSRLARGGRNGGRPLIQVLEIVKSDDEDSSDVSNQSSFCPDPRRLAQPFGVGQSYANTQS